MTGYLAILGAVSIWAFFNGVLVKSIKSTSGLGVGVWTALVGIALYIVGFSFQELLELKLPEILALTGLGLFAALNNGCFYTALKISIPNAALFHYLAPMLVIAWTSTIPIFYSPVATFEIVALIIGFIGIAFVAMPNFKGNNLKLVYLGSGSAIFYSLEIVLSGYISDDMGINPQIPTLFKLVFQAITMLVLALLFKQVIKVEDKKEWLKIIFGGFILYLSFILYFEGAATVSDLHRGVLGYIDRVGAIVLGAWIFKEKLSKNIILGGFLILGAGLLLLL